MDPVDDLQQTTRLRFDLSLRYKIDVLSITREQKDRATQGICLQKPVGKLEFTLNTKFLNISALKTNFDILFKGTKIAPDIVRWNAQLPAGPVNIKTKVGDAKITKLGGSFETTVKAIAPPLSDTSCEGEEQGLVVEFETPDDTGQLSADADAGFTTATIDVSRLRVAGKAGDRETFSVVIQQHHHSECVNAAIEGQPASFFALVSGVPQYAPLSYQWFIDGGAVPMGPTTNASFKARMPSPPEAVMVSVVVTVTQANAQKQLSDSRPVSIITEQVALRIEHFCKLVMQTPINQFVRPLWDPLHDLVTRPMTLGQAKELQEFSQRLNRLSARLVRVQTRRSTDVRSRTKRTQRRVH